jgi:hypothetical protein
LVSKSWTVELATWLFGWLEGWIDRSIAEWVVWMDEWMNRGINGWPNRGESFMDGCFISCLLAGQFIAVLR